MYNDIYLIYQNKKKEASMADKKEKPTWLDIVNMLINFGILLVAMLALIFK